MNAFTQPAVVTIADLEQSTRSQTTITQLLEDAQNLIRRATEIQTGNAEADRDCRAFADNVCEAMEDKLRQGACWTLAAGERERQNEADEAEWEEWKDRGRSELNRVRL